MVKDTDDDAGLALYLRSSEMLLVLRDLLGHTSVLTTEAYLSRLDTSRIFRDLYVHAGREHGLLDDGAAGREAAEEFGETGEGA